MTGEELSALIKDEIGEDARLHAILGRIRDGKANLTDSELYAAITARITAQQMRRNVLSLEKREAAFVGITRERYTDTFTVFSAVQRILDAESGIHIRPKEPGFDTGRARKIGHSLEDRTVPDSTIERRARSATENFCMSHHDDCMRVNAEFRARAGLQSYAIRDVSAKCCDWCADVSGKYPANETPAGFWGRHDNCKCSILYESKRSGRQLLRGTSKKWEVVPENAGAEPLVRLTKEQAQALQEKHGTVVLTKEQALALQAVHGLTYGRKPAIIKNIELPPETDQIRSMSAETKQLISEAFDKIMGMYEVHLDQLTTEPIYKEDGKTIAKTVPFQFQPRRGKAGELIKCIVINSGYDFMDSQAELQKRIMRNFNKGALASNSIDGLIAHEIAHVITFQDIVTYGGYLVENRIISERVVEGISTYADIMNDGAECIAEAFAARICGLPISEEAQALLDEFIERKRKHG